MKKYSNYAFQIYSKKNDDMTNATINWTSASLLVRKKLYVPCLRRKIVIRPIIINGMVSGFNVRAPYWFVKQVLRRLRFKPLIDEDFNIQNCFGCDCGYGYREEWESPSTSDIPFRDK